MAEDDASEMAGRLRVARSRQLLAEYRSKERVAEEEFAKNMMLREKEDRLRISSRVRTANAWAKSLGDSRRFQLLSLPADLLSPYGRVMANNDSSVAVRAKQLEKELASKAPLSQPLEPRPREEVHRIARDAMTRVASPPRTSTRRPKSASRSGLPRLASSTSLRPSSAVPASSSLARATIPSVSDNRVVIKISKPGEEARQLSVALFEREFGKLSRRVEEMRKSGKAARKKEEERRLLRKGRGGADQMLIDEAEAVVDARASPMVAAALAAAKARRTKVEVQGQLRRALRETAFLTEALREQARLLRERGWNTGGRNAVPSVAPDGVPQLAKQVDMVKAETEAAKGISLHSARS